MANVHLTSGTYKMKSLKAMTQLLLSCIARLLWMSEVAFFSLDKDTFEEDKNGRNTGKLQNGSLLKDFIFLKSS